MSISTSIPFCVISTQTIEIVSQIWTLQIQQTWNEPLTSNHPLINFLSAYGKWSVALLPLSQFHFVIYSNNTGVFLDKKWFKSFTFLLHFFLSLSGALMSHTKWILSEGNLTKSAPNILSPKKERTISAILDLRGADASLHSISCPCQLIRKIWVN